MSVEVLEQLGVPVFVPRESGFNFYTRDTLFNPHNLVINADCLVIYFSNARYSKEELQTLYGMLGVIVYNNEKFSLIEILTNTALDIAKIKTTITKYPAKSILILDKNFKLNLDGVLVFNTFSPQHLNKNTQDKRQAFNDLLVVKKYLSDLWQK